MVWCGACACACVCVCVCVCVQVEVQRLSTANDEIPDLQKRVRTLEEERERHSATVNQLEVRRINLIHHILPTHIIQH